jgi:hypothetical protein
MDAVLCALAGDARGAANGMAVPDSRCVLVQPITDEWSYGTVLPDTPASIVTLASDYVAPRLPATCETGESSAPECRIQRSDRPRHCRRSVSAGRGYRRGRTTVPNRQRGWLARSLRLVWNGGREEPRRGRVSCGALRNGSPRTTGWSGVPLYCCFQWPCCGTSEDRDMPSQGRWCRAKCLVRTTASRSCRSYEAGGLVAGISPWRAPQLFAATGRPRPPL